MPTQANPNLPATQRKHCRDQRRQLSAIQQKQHALNATRLFLRSHWAQRPKKIAVYLAHDSELSTHPLINALWKRGHKLYLPILKSAHSRNMTFAPYEPNTPLQKNKYGILEPNTQHQQHLNGQQLDIVLTPLTCFDLNGNRIGMGGGYYDKAFAFKAKQIRKGKTSKPALIGWAHRCQKVDKITTQPWDIPLNGVFTERFYKRF